MTNNNYNNNNNNNNTFLKMRNTIFKEAYPPFVNFHLFTEFRYVNMKNTINKSEVCYFLTR